MKILLALAAFALAAILVVSATMGAETLVPGGDEGKNQPVGGLAPSGGKPRIMPAGLSPPALKGTGFKPGERVTVKISEGAKATYQTTANSSGSFTVRMPNRAGQCRGMTVVAVGDKGSRAGFQLSEFACAAPGVNS